MGGSGEAVGATIPDVAALYEVMAATAAAAARPVARLAARSALRLATGGVVIGAVSEG